MFNKVVLVGRISTDLELRQTANGKSYCKFNLAVNRMNEGTDFISISVWGKSAENIVAYQNKGSLILVEGSINSETYIDIEGNNKKIFEVISKNVHFLGNRRSEQTEKEETLNTSDPYEEIGKEIDLDNFFD